MLIVFYLILLMFVCVYTAYKLVVRPRGLVRFIFLVRAGVREEGGSLEFC